MIPAQYRAELARLGLSQAEAGLLLGVSTRTAHGYANGQPIPRSVEIALTLMTKHQAKTLLADVPRTTIPISQTGT